MSVQNYIETEINVFTSEINLYHYKNPNNVNKT